MRIARVTFAMMAVNLAFVGAIAYFSPGVIAGILTGIWLPAFIAAVGLVA